MFRPQQTKTTAATLISGVIVLAMTGAPAAHAQPLVGAITPPTGPCPVVRTTTETVQHFSKRVISCAAAKWVVPGGAAKAICIASRESGLVPTARSATGQYLGLFQHSKVSWPSRYADWTAPAWHLRTHALNGRTNTIVTLRMVHGFGGWAPAGWKVRGC